MIGADLGPQLEGFDAKLVETGRYNSKSEVMGEGIHLIQERDLDEAAPGRLSHLGVKRRASIDSVPMPTASSSGVWT